MSQSLLVSGFKSGLGSACLQFSFERLATFGSLALKEIGVIWGVEDELRKLQRTYFKVQGLVDRVESSKLRFSSGSKAWRIWYEDLRKLAYDADALLDHISLHLSTYCSTTTTEATLTKGQVRSMVLSSFQLNLPHEINRMQKNLEDLAREMESLIFIEKVESNIFMRETSYSSNTLVNTTSLLAVADERAIVGRQQDKENVLQLLGKASDDVISVIPLVGMGGIGKTTLAQLVYTDKQVRSNFGLRIWVSISIDLDVTMITKTIIESATRKSCTFSDLNLLQLMLQEILESSERFLLVLDNYWSEIDDDWNLLLAPFRFGCKGSNIIVTTRSLRTSTIIGSVEAYKLPTLSDDDCWKLMKQKAFFKKQENEILEVLGKDIAKKCKGLPLAAKAVGSLLNLQFSKADWRTVLKSELWDLPQDHNGIFPSLMLSYLYLPSHLRKCFAYCSLFPKNHEFEVEELVCLWMAEGFIESVGEREVENIGSDYFNDLYLRSFFQLDINSLNQTVYKMHDLIHDLTRLVSVDMSVQVKHDMLDHYPLFGNACHLSLHLDNLHNLELKASHINERLRTFIVMSKNGVARGEIDQNLFSYLKYVRVLDLSNIGLKMLPNSIDHLIFLRYLNLSGNVIITLPKSLGKLLALQTLKLLKNPELIILPVEMKNLSNLRHLHFDVDGKLSCLPPELGNLTNLQTLSAFLVRRRKGHGIEELMNMNSLRGSLSIKNLNNVSYETNARDAQLEMKPYLDKLELLWEELNDQLEPQVLNREIEQQARVITNLRPHENLRELALKNYSGIRCPVWLSDSRRRFTEIRLEGLVNCESLPCFGQLPFLKSLCIGQMYCLKSIDNTFYGAGNIMKFPSLEFLELYQMTELESWTDPIGENSMPNLTTFTLDSCPKLISIPSNVRSLRNSNISRCPVLPLA